MKREREREDVRSKISLLREEEREEMIGCWSTSAGLSADGREGWPVERGIEERRQGEIKRFLESCR